MNRSYALLVLVLLFQAGLLGAEEPQGGRDNLVIETLLRLDNIDVNANENLKATVHRFLKAHRAEERYFQIIEKFALRDFDRDLLSLAGEDSTSTAGVRGVGIVLRHNADAVAEVLNGSDEKLAIGVAEALGIVGTTKATDLLRPLICDESKPASLRIAAANALGRQPTGQQQLLDFVVDMKLPQDLTFTVANLLHSSNDPAIREAADQHLPLPATANAEPLPPVAELVKQSGDAGRGLAVFTSKGTCNKCHTVKGQGKDVGPDLSEIGSKLSPEAMFVAILDPNAGVSHNYETYSIATDEGLVLAGLKVSETDEVFTLKTKEGIVLEIAQDSIIDLKKQPVSIMPADLQKLMTVQDLVDTVAVLQTLKKAD